MIDDDRPVYSRPGRTSRFGKADADVKSSVPEIIKAEVTMMASAQEVTPSEYIRNVLTDHLHGAIDPSIQSIIWQHAEREVTDKFLLDLLRKAIFGHLHELSLATGSEKNSPGIGRVKAVS